MKFKIKKNDTVKVITGKEKGKTGKVRSVNYKSNMVIVEGLNMVTKHVKRTSESAGTRFKKEAPLHISNVALWNAETSEIIKVGFQRVADEKGKVRSVRVNKKTQQPID